MTFPISLNKCLSPHHVHLCDSNLFPSSLYLGPSVSQFFICVKNLQFYIMILKCFKFSSTYKWNWEFSFRFGFSKKYCFKSIALHVNLVLKIMIPILILKFKPSFNSIHYNWNWPSLPINVGMGCPTQV
jgi:hypothetical protein